MSVAAFSARVSLGDAAYNFISGVSRPWLGTILKVASYAWIIPIGVVAIRAYLQYSGRRTTSFGQKHPEFSGLMQRAQNLTAVENFKAAGPVVPSRYVRVGTDVSGLDKLFIKTPIGKRWFLNHPLAKNDQLAFLISHRLGLGVVPPTIALEGYSQEMETLLPNEIKYADFGRDKMFKISFQGVVVQEGVVLHENRSRFNRDDLDLEQIQRAIIFNLIVGRYDGDWNNTVIDRSGRVMEIDNERLGALRATDSWLLSEYPKMFFSERVIDSFLSKPASVVSDVFEEMGMFNFDESLKTNIQRNFEKIREFFILHKGGFVKDLKDFLLPK